MNPSHKRPIVFAVRDFPVGCGTHSNVSRSHLPEKPLKNPRVSVTDHVPAPKPNGTSSFRPETEIRNPSRRTDHVAAAPKAANETSSSRQETEFRNTSRRTDHVTAANGTSSLRRETEFSNPNSNTDHVVAARKHTGTSSQRREPEIRGSDSDPTPREKVLDALRLFKEVFKQLARDKASRRSEDPFDSTSRIDLKTLTVIEEMGKQVNIEKRIGSVPGIEVGDEFQYKTELRVVGLHSKPMCGIDYTKIGEEKFATSIVASEGYGYDDKFASDVMVYTGEGGNVINKGKETEDQKLVKGNLALVNSMREKKEVRVIRGEERLDKKGKRYIYNGLYLVNEYWLEKGARGKSVFKFKLCRIPGQPPLTWKKQYYC